MKNIAGICAAGLISLVAFGTAFAEDRALLIGLSEHQDTSIRGLSGHKDLMLAKQIARDLGYKNIKVLEDSQASREGILAGLRWLREGVHAGDHALLYFTGHGDQLPDDNGDETDGKDEFLVPWDTRLTSRGAENIIIDDEMNKMLSQIRGETLVLIDSCHSGTITKSLGSGVVSKRLGYGGVRTKANISVSAAESKAEYAAFSACMDEQTAWSTSNGSLFTLGLQRLVSEVKNSGSPHLSLEQASGNVNNFIRDITAREGWKAHNPVVDGSQNWRSKNIFIERTEGSGGSGSENSLDDIVNQAGSPLDFSSSKPSYAIGERVFLNITIPGQGYLNMISVGDDGSEPVLLFPNGFKEENYFASGRTISIPRDVGSFKWTANGPAGDIAIYAFFTSEPLNLWKQGDKALYGQFKELTRSDMIQTKEILVYKASMSVSEDNGDNHQGLSAGRITLTVR